MRKLFVVAGLSLLCAGTAHADVADLKQSLSDLRSQADDKEKMDTLGATKVELSQVSGWLDDATNAIKLEAEKKARRFFTLVRAQLKLVDQLVVLAKLQQEAKKLEADISGLKEQKASAKSQLEDKRVQLKALQMTKGK